LGGLWALEWAWHAAEKKLALRKRILCERHENNRITTDGDINLQTEDTF